MRTIFVILFLLVVKSNSVDILGTVKDLASSIGQIAENVGSTVSNVSQNVGSHIGSTFNSAVQNAGNALSNLKDSMGEKWNELTNTSKVVAGNLGENINKAFGENGTMGNLTSHLESVWSSLKDNVDEKWNTSKNVASNLGQDIKMAFGENGTMKNLTSHLGSTLEQKFSELKALALKVKARLMSDFSNETVIEKIATTLNERHNEASNGSNPSWKILPSRELSKFNAELNALKNANNLPDYCTPVRDRVVGIIESENVILNANSYKEIIDVVMKDARLVGNETGLCYSAMAAAATVKKASKQK